VRRLAAPLAVVVAAIALAVATHWHPLVVLDRRVDSDANVVVRAHATLLTLARVGTRLGDPTVVTLGAVVAAVALARWSTRRAATYVLLVRAAAVVVGWLAKEAIRRHRPVLVHPVAHATGFSFPSGHALGSAAFYTSLVIAVGTRIPRAIAGIVAVLVPAAVAATRVLLGVHFPSDVVAGLLLGWLVALVVVRLWDPGCSPTVHRASVE
jgi:undecaprenyl-diphosphatase